MRETDHSIKIKQEITNIIEASSPKQLQDSLTEYHPSDLAEAFQHLDDEQQLFVLQSLNFHVLAELFEYLNDAKAVKYLNLLSNQKGANILETMEPDDAADILQKMKAQQSDDLYKIMHEESRNVLKKLSAYKLHTAGAIMTTDFISLQRGMDIKDAMRHLIREASSTEGIQRLFVLDDKNFLHGAIELKNLIQARAPKTIDDIMYTDIISVHIDDDVEEAARLIQNYGIYVMPVVNDKNQLQGVITMDDAADILDEATDEDYAKFAGISGNIVLNDTLIRSALHRLPWLILLLFLGLIISTIISRFEETIDQIAVLVLFQPLILDMAGNTGTQSLAVTVRGLSKNHFSLKGSTKKHLFKELRVGMINGLTIGVISIITSLLFLTIVSPTMAIGTPLQVALTVGISASIALTFATLFGAFFPMFLTKIKVDPAVASGPFITTLNDVIGLIIYFTLAMLIIL